MNLQRVFGHPFLCFFGGSRSVEAITKTYFFFSLPLPRLVSFPSGKAISKKASSASTKPSN
jgi:hypothetical protein